MAYVIFTDTYRVYEARPVAAATCGQVDLVMEAELTQEEQTKTCWISHKWLTLIWHSRETHDWNRRRSQTDAAEPR